ncbi:hypothetical protein, partial [Thalassospira permensis]|uniref:hypothetical protein n=1 Tax=Thalassospira permensis TaxID=680197 RepID=UPI001969C122
GERTPNLPKAAAMGAVAASDCSPSVVDRLGQYARRPSVGKNGERPRCVWTSGWQIVAVAGAGNEPVGGL